MLQSGTTQHHNPTTGSQSASLIEVKTRPAHQNYVSGVEQASSAMRRVTEYKQHAKDCRARAASSVRSDDKVVLEKIAKIWDKIAALRERDLEEPDEK